MRTSNKIVLGIFVAPLLIIACVHVALYAKYKSGNYVVMKTVKQDRYMRYALKNINRVTVSGVNNVNIITADSIKLELEKGDEHLIYKIQGDSLLVEGTSRTKNGKDEEISRSNNQVNLYLPSMTIITAQNAALNLTGSKDSTKAASYQFILSLASSIKVTEDGDDTSHVYFRNLSIRANHASALELSGQTWISGLQLAVIESEFTDNGAHISKLELDADEKSSITLKGDNLKRVNTVH